MIKIGFLLYICINLIDSRLLSIKTKLYEEEFIQWISEYKTGFLASADYEYRLEVFSKNYELIEKHNNSKSTYTLGLNQFANLTFEEFSKMYLLDPKDNIFLNNNTSNEPNNYKRGPSVATQYKNWTEEGKVAPVENQGTCGSCYIFSAVAGAESYHAIYKDPTNPPPVFSKQHMLDCGSSFNYGLMGCQGGLTSVAFEFLQKKGNILESDYPYLAYKDTCKDNLPVFSKINGFVKISDGVSNLVEAVEKRPVTIGFEMTSSLVFYKSGVYKTHAPCGFFKNHGVLIVGYDLRPKIPYFIIKNSYGETWGDKGYIKFAIGDQNSSGMCLLANGEKYAPSV